MNDRADSLGERIETPTSAAIAGLAFGFLMIAVIVLLHISVPGSPTQTLADLDPDRQQAARTAAALMPFAGIAFLWFIGVLRAEIGRKEDQFFATVLLGSGLLWVAMSFAATATLATLLTLLNSGLPANDHSVLALQMLTLQLSGTFGTRMAAVFVMSVTTIGRKARLLSKPVVAIGLVVALTLLLSPPLTRWMQLVFPLWVIMLSTMILVRARRRG